MSKPELDRKFFEDLEVGQVFTTGTRVFTQVDVMTFGYVTGDQNPIHIEKFVESAPINQKIDRWNFFEPVLVGQGIQVAMIITGLNRLKWLPRGLATFSFRVFREQDAVLVAQGECGFLVTKRPKS